MNDQERNKKAQECLKHDHIKYDDMVAKIKANEIYKNKVRFMTLGEIKALFRLHNLNDQIKLEPKTMMTTLKLMKAW